ncbi:MAG: cysteine--tRNA ligase, partial [Gammaproteobacteria bacterium]|nr:cysteine--tRNA ligase [Gammaproteobacteria bacterium]
VDLPQNTDYANRFEAAMNDDFNTVSALAVLFDLAREINRAKSDDPDAVDALASLLRNLGGIIGLLEKNAGEFLKLKPGPGDGLADVEIEAMIQQRLDARKNKDWKQADRIRDELGAAGIAIEDGPEGTRWRRS